ncbi:hypothetical protein KKB40_00375 [Patescibacteria group bacterium]|nr:hypothetical protein [Patescibacteria group bacterium]
MDSIFPNTAGYLNTLNLEVSDKLDLVAKELLTDEAKYERASQALRRRFSRGAEIVDGVDREGRGTKIRREGSKGKYRYFIEGTDGNWNQPDERIWVVAMYALWQASK